ncbi:hypothetical protein D3C71_1707040 [compost metagenome]
MCVKHPADFAAVQYTLQIHNGIEETVLGDDRKHRSAFCGSGIHAVTFLQRSSHRFFDNDMFAVVQEVHSNFRMAEGRGTDANQIKVL